MPADFTWVSNGHTYELYKTPKTWDDANAFAQSLGGNLVKVDDAAENSELYTQISSAISSSEYANTTSQDGGGSAYVWLGASDATTEGSWKWVADNSTLSTSRTEWGSGTVEGYFMSEPDGDTYQNHLAIGLEQWPNASYGLTGNIGDAGEWNDVDGSSTLYFVVEYSQTTPTQPQ